MNTKAKVGLLSFTSFFILTTSLTDFSIIGFWTDIIIGLALLVKTIIVFSENRFIWTSKRIKIGIGLAIVSFVIVTISNPFYFDRLKTKSFVLKRVEGSFYNAYFVPVGSYSGGEGNLIITKSISLFPIIERQKFYKHAVLWDFRASEFDGQPVDQNKVIKSYIKDEVRK